MDLTAAETQIAEEVAHVLDHLGRVLGAVEDGKWVYAAEKAGSLVRAATALDRRLEAAGRQQTGRPPRVGRIDAAIRQEARHYWLGRVLYPVDAAGREALALYQASVTPDRPHGWPGGGV